MEDVMRSEFLPFSTPTIEEAEINEVVDCLRSGWITTGPKVKRFEEAFGAYVGAPFAVPLSSATAGLHLTLLALKIQEGDEIITTPMTFASTVSMIVLCGGTPVFADIEPGTLNIDATKIREKISSRTRAIIPVHFAGQSCDMDPIFSLATEFGLTVIEDAAHAAGSEYKGQRIGSLDSISIFSFHPNKNITTGEGGMVCTRDEALAEEVSLLKFHGMNREAWKRFAASGTPNYDIVLPGFKYNMMDLAAAIGIEQLRRVEPNWRLRQKVWEAYNQAFSGLPIKTPAEPEPGNLHAFHLYTIQVNAKLAGITRDEFLTGMTKQNIGVGVHYQSIPEHPYYQQALGWKPADYPQAMKIGQEIVSLPISAKLTAKDIDDVIRAVKNLVG